MFCSTSNDIDESDHTKLLELLERLSTLVLLQFQLGLAVLVNAKHCQPLCVQLDFTYEAIARMRRMHVLFAYCCLCISVEFERSCPI